MGMSSNDWVVMLKSEVGQLLDKGEDVRARVANLDDVLVDKEVTVDDWCRWKTHYLSGRADLVSVGRSGSTRSGRAYASRRLRRVAQHVGIMKSEISRSNAKVVAKID